MGLYSPGDQVICRVKDNDIVNIYETAYEAEYIFDIVSEYDQGWLVYVPLGMVLKSAMTVNIENFQKFGVHKKFIDSEVIYISEYKIAKLYSKLDGMFCEKCGEFYFMASANQDNGTLVCWICRHYKYH